MSLSPPFAVLLKKKEKKMTIEVCIIMLLCAEDALVDGVHWDGLSRNTGAQNVSRDLQHFSDLSTERFPKFW